jgi:hypothetical protein
MIKTIKTYNIYIKYNKNLNNYIVINNLSHKIIFKFESHKFDYLNKFYNIILKKMLLF